MGKKSKKVQKMHKHEYEIFTVEGILAVAAAIIAAYYSAQSGETDLDGSWIRINTGQYVYDGFIYNSETGKLLKDQLPISTKGSGMEAVLRIPVDISISEYPSEFVKGGPGDIIYDPDSNVIIILGNTQDQHRKAVRLGKLDDFLHLHWSEPTELSINIELK